MEKLSDFNTFRVRKTTVPSTFFQIKDFKGTVVIRCIIIFARGGHLKNDTYCYFKHCGLPRVGINKYVESVIFDLLSWSE